MTTLMVAKYEQPLRDLPMFGDFDGESEEAELGLGWRLLETSETYRIGDIAMTLTSQTGHPAMVAYGSDKGFLILRFSEKPKKVSSLLVNGVELARAAGVVDAKYKSRPLVAQGFCSSWSKKAGLKHNYDAVKVATTREADPDIHGEELFRTYMVALGLPNCETVDPYWNAIGGIVTAERKAKWIPNIDIRIDL